MSNASSEARWTAEPSSTRTRGPDQRVADTARPYSRLARVLVAEPDQGRQFAIVACLDPAPEIGAVTAIERGDVTRFISDTSGYWPHVVVVSDTVPDEQGRDLTAARISEDLWQEFPHVRVVWWSTDREVTPAMRELARAAGIFAVVGAADPARRLLSAVKNAFGDSEAWSLGVRRRRPHEPPSTSDAAQRSASLAIEASAGTRRSAAVEPPMARQRRPRAQGSAQ